MNDFKRERFCELLDNAHNLPLQVAVELGLPVAMSGLGVITAVVVRSRPWREANPEKQGLWVVLGIIAAHSLLEYPLWYGPFQATVAISVVKLSTCLTKCPSIADEKPIHQLTLLLALITTAAVIAVGWRYEQVAQLYRAPDQRWPDYRQNTLAKVGDSWLYSGLVEFARFTTASPKLIATENGCAIGERVLRFSPEPSVVSRLVECEYEAGNDAKAKQYESRFERVYPKDYNEWREERVKRLKANS